MPPFNFKTLEERVSSASTLDEAWAALAKAPEDFLAGKAIDIGTAFVASAIASRFAEFDSAQQQNLGPALQWAARVALFSTADQDPETRYAIQKVREKVGDWLRQLPWTLRSRFTPDIISLAVAALPNDNWKQACWLLSSVGWRDQQAVNALREGSLKRQTEKADMLFSTLLDLGIPMPERSEYLHEAHDRYLVRKNRANILSIHLLSDESSLQVLGQTLPTGNETENDKMVWLFLPQTIAHIAYRYNTERVGSRAIDLLKKLLTSHEAEMRSGIYLGGAVVSKCNSRKAVRFLLELITRELNSPSQHNLMLLTRRLEACVGSNQVRALNLSRHGTEIRRVFSSVLKKNNPYKGRDLTFEADVKDHLWNLCLTLGTEKADKVGFDFIEADQNPYTQFTILADLACLALDPLPSRVVRWASEPSVLHSDNEGTDEIQRMESIRVVTSAGTIRAFDILLHSKYLTLHGHTLADSADGLAYLAVTLAQHAQHRAYVVDELFKVLERGPEGPQPGAVSSAITDLAFVGIFEERHFLIIVRYLLMEPNWTKEAVVKSRLVSAIGTAPRSLIPDELITKLEAWAGMPDRRLSTSCLETLIKQGLFPGRGGSLEQRLKFTKSTTAPNLRPRDADDVNGGIYALLAHRHPQQYEADFAMFLQSCAFGSLVEAMETLGRLQMKELRTVPFPIRWAEALISRAVKNNTRYNSESHIFVLLGTYASTLLASTLWAKSLSNWTPETREALATALGNLPPESKSTDQASRTLTDLQNDTHFGVRRAAFRSLGRVAPSLLGTMVNSWAVSESPDVRKLATEAMYWIPRELRSQFHWLTLTRRLSEDVAEDVRDSLWISKERARKITWARKYLEKLISSIPQSNKEILKKWKYAEAISRVGDDESITKLSHFLRSNKLPANFQRFLIRTIERLQKNWEKCRQKWSEPFPPGSATTKTGVGSVTVDGKKILLEYLVWQRPDILQPEILSWGGTAIAKAVLSRDVLKGKLAFTDAEGQTWDIWVRSWTPLSNFSFVGGDRRPS